MDQELKEYLEQRFTDIDQQFKNIRSEMATKEGLKTIKSEIDLLRHILVTKEDLKLSRMVMRGEIKNIESEVTGKVNHTIDIQTQYMKILLEAILHRLDTIIEGHPSSAAGDNHLKKGNLEFTLRLEQ